MVEKTIKEITEQKIPRIYANAIDKMIAEIPEDWNEKEKARYVYINLGKLLAYDERYTVGSTTQQRRLFKLAKERVIDFNEIKENKKFKGICIDLNRLYANVLIKKLGIKRVYINYGYGIMPHDSVSAELDGQFSSFDLQRDLINIQLNCPTDFFGFHDDGDDYCEVTYKDSEVAAIDKKLNFKNYNYSGRPIISKLREKFEAVFFYDQDDEAFDDRIRFRSLPLKAKVEEMLRDIATIPGIKNLGYTERTRVYWRMLKYGLEYANERKRVRIDNLYTVSKETKLPKDVVEVFSVMYPEDDIIRHARYIYDHVNKEYVKISNLDLLNKIKDEGLTSKRKIFSAQRRFQKEYKMELAGEKKYFTRLDRDVEDGCGQTINIGDRKIKFGEAEELNVVDDKINVVDEPLIVVDMKEKAKQKTNKTKQTDEGIDY